MERVLVYGKKGEYIEDVLGKHGFDVVEDQPEVVVAFGGDGTFLESELKYPGVPKLFIKHSSNCKNCKNHNFTEIVSKLKEGKYKMINVLKVEASVNGRKKLLGLNDINIHYVPPRALRFSVKVNKKKIVEHVIGDGVIVSTSYGSTAYFHAICGKKFKSGIGLAFNNPTMKHKPLVVKEDDVIKVKILRGEGIIVADCNNKGILLSEGDEVTIKKSIGFANIIELKGMKIKIHKF